MFFLNTFQAYLFYVTDSLITIVMIQSSESLHTRLGNQWADLLSQSFSILHFCS